MSFSSKIYLKIDPTVGSICSFSSSDVSSFLSCRSNNGFIIKEQLVERLLFDKTVCLYAAADNDPDTWKKVSGQSRASQLSSTEAENKRRCIKHANV